MATHKGPGEAVTVDASHLRIGIVHARWNSDIIEPLVNKARDRLLESGVQDSNITIESVPGSWELPIACAKVFAASQVLATTASSLGAGDLLGSSTTDLATLPTNVSSTKPGPFDAIIAIGVLIKGETMHFEYISDAVTRGLMQLQLEKNFPLIFGVLTVLSTEQAVARIAHAEDWANAAIEMASKKKRWEMGDI